MSVQPETAPVTLASEISGVNPVSSAVLHSAHCFHTQDAGALSWDFFPSRAQVINIDICSSMMYSLSLIKSTPKNNEDFFPKSVYHPSITQHRLESTGTERMHAGLVFLFLAVCRFFF